ncbi:hypothetical protein [Corynebacterium cystitidis]|uniref:hypothetical protein n=1 Tax=Corynebacterium cystitidis TaxID=35757 RepID=UPI00211E5AF3|nr:hypothetical protein [Corynebacterium cystitidis]
MAEKKNSAAKNEAQGIDTVLFSVDINDKTISLEAPADLMEADPDAYIAYEERKYGLMLKSILGEPQWEKLRSAGMTTKQLIQDVMPAYQEAAGLGED